MIGRGVVASLGLVQLIAWGATYYLIGVFGEAMTAELGWGRAWVYGGYSLSMLVMGLCSSAVGRRIDRDGGRPVMIAGAWLGALACVLLAMAHHRVVWLAAWALMGVAMRATLYDAAFATLARLGGEAARRPIAQITLLGGLASTVFWPFGHALAGPLGWRGALLVYALCLLGTVPLLRLLPAAAPRPVARGATVVSATAATSTTAASTTPSTTTSSAAAPAPPPRPTPRAADEASLRLAGLLYASITTLSTMLNAGLSAHTIGLLEGLGMGAVAAVGYASLRGVGQSVARALEVMFGRRLDPVRLNLFACLLMPVGLAAGYAAGGSTVAALAFALVFGAGNGLLSITRGTLPLVLFDIEAYGRITGRLLAPGFIGAAVAPLLLALVIEHQGPDLGLGLLVAASTLVALAAVLLAWRFGPRLQAAPASANGPAEHEGRGRIPR